MSSSRSPGAGPTEGWGVPEIKWQQLQHGTLLGRGHHAFVYSATLTSPDGEKMPVALKKLIPKPLAEKTVPLQEARVLQALEGVAGVPRLYGITDSPPHALVMSRCSGVTLWELRRRGEVRTCLIAVQKLCTILSRMHARGVTHGDLHGCNVIVNRHGISNACVWLIDFGNAKRNTGIEMIQTDEKQLWELLINILTVRNAFLDGSVLQQFENINGHSNLVEISSFVCNILRNERVLK